jgi:hypothetical protein
MFQNMCKFLYYTMVSKYSGGGTCPTSTSTSFGSTINSYFFWIVDDQYRSSSGCAVKDDWYQQFLDAIAENYRRIVVPVRLPRCPDVHSRCQHGAKRRALRRKIGISDDLIIKYGHFLPINGYKCFFLQTREIERTLTYFNMISPCLS